MQSLINKLFNGNANAECENLIDSAMHERNVKLDDAEKRETKFVNTLSDEQKKLFNEWRTAQGDVWCDEVDLAYERGFKTGALLMIEVHDITF
jgi:hypothetical protein